MTTQTDRAGGTPTSIATERATGIAFYAAIKAPCLCFANSNLTLSGEQTIDGVTTDESRVAAFGQTDASQNGIYITSTGEWQRAPDWRDNGEVMKGTMFRVTDGSLAALYYVTTDDPIVIGTTEVTVAADDDDDVAAIAANGSIVFGANDVVIQHATNTLTFTGGSLGYRFDADILPVVDAFNTLGDGTHGWWDINFASGAWLSWGVGDVTFEHSSNYMAIRGATIVDVLGQGGTTQFELVETGDGADAGPEFFLFKDSASPAALDVGAIQYYYGRDSGGNSTLYAYEFMQIIDPTNGSEDAIIGWGTRINSSLDDRLKLGAGLYTKNATGGDKGLDTINASAIYDDGVLIDIAGLAKFWAKVTANSTTILASHNVTSVTDTATGAMTVTIATDFSSAHWCCQLTVENLDSSFDAADDAMSTWIRNGSMAAGTIIMEAHTEANAGLIDPATWHIVGFGSQ